MIPAVAVAILFFGLLAALAGFGIGSWPIVGLYAVMSAVLFVMYGLDKAAAGKGRRRIAEATLQWFGAAGGWPGGLVAQQLFRHKTRKRSFQVVFWSAVIANCAVLAWILSGEVTVALDI